MDAPPIPPETDPAALALVVVGAHLRAELGDRSAATALAHRLDRALWRRGSALRACVVTDLWQLNDDRLAGCPLVAVGEPSVNATTAYLADKLPSVLSAESLLVIQLDLTFRELHAACWGSTHASTAHACELFAERYLEGYADALAAWSLADAEP